MVLSNLLIGTHALLEDKVVFNNLGLVVIDEQVTDLEFSKIKALEKNDFPPHVLVMTYSNT